MKAFWVVVGAMALIPDASMAQDLGGFEVGSSTQVARERLEQIGSISEGRNTETGELVGMWAGNYGVELCDGVVFSITEKFPTNTPREWMRAVDLEGRNRGTSHGFSIVRNDAEKWAYTEVSWKLSSAGSLGIVMLDSADQPLQVYKKVGAEEICQTR